MSPWTVGALAERLGGAVRGEASGLISGVATLEQAGPQDLSFLANRRYARGLQDTRAGAVLTCPGERAPERLTLIEVADPYDAFAVALGLFYPARWPAAGVHALAHVASDAVVLGATVDALAVVEAGARVGEGTWLMPHSYVGRGARVGRHCRLMPGAVVMDGCVLGDRVWLNPGAVVGGEGFGFAPGPDGHRKIPQVGTARVGDDVEIGSNSCVDRAALGETVVGAGAKLDNLVQVGHAAEIGAHSLMVAYSGVAGSARLGPGVVLAAKAAVLGHIEVGAGTRVGVASVVHNDQPAGAEVSGVPAIPHREWLRVASAARQLPELLRKVRALEREVARLEAARIENGIASGEDS